MSFSRKFRGTYVEVWQQFAQEVGGTWTDPHASGGTPSIEVPHPRGAVRIEGHTQLIMTGKVMIPVLSTKFSALMPATHAQRFSVSRASFATGIAEWFGALDIQVDDPEFDAAFVLKGETPDLVRALFASPALRERFLRDFDGQMHRRDDKVFFSDPTPDADPFELTVAGFIDDPAKLRALYDLFVETLVRLPDGPSGTPRTP
jgi:hypothetical protein